MTSPSQIYATQVVRGEITEDSDQVSALEVLDRTFDALVAPNRRSWWWVGNRREAFAKSVYLYGPVGRGKSRIMDTFVAALEGRGLAERVHFHAFMLGVHQRIHELQQNGKGGDPLPVLAKELAARAPVLCFDEFVVNNIADAMILGRLFEALWAVGITLVSTSNFAPDELYKDGLQRARFEPFIEKIKAEMQVVKVAGPLDYRTIQGGPAEIFFAPFTMASRLDFEDNYKRLSLSQMGGPRTITVSGRPIELPWAASRVAMATFANLCERPLGAADYLALSKEFFAIALDEVPELTYELRNEAARFRVLIDTLYEAGTLLLLRSAVSIDELYGGTKDTENNRVLSRLKEMRSEQYVKVALARLDGQGSSP